MKSDEGFEALNPFLKLLRVEMKLESETSTNKLKICSVMQNKCNTNMVFGSDCALTKFVLCFESFVFPFSIDRSLSLIKSGLSSFENSESISGNYVYLTCGH